MPGAAVENGLADGLGDGDGLGLGVAGVGVAGVGVGVAGVGVAAPGTVTPGGLVLGAEVPGGAALCVAPPGAPVLGRLVLGAPVLGALPEVVAPGVPPAEVVGVAAPVRPGENDGGVVGGELEEQADTGAIASRARAAQPSRVPRERRRPWKQDQRALQTLNGLLITVISGYAGRTP